MTLCEILSLGSTSAMASPTTTAVTMCILPNVAFVRSTLQTSPSPPGSSSVYLEISKDPKKCPKSCAGKELCSFAPSWNRNACLTPRFKLTT
ncbi:hypothetical protein BD779DRAFT_1581855 [Infundibulicybe gibba]|nr:hypothetical protein BD779DRAFT_1581855 [Infundibulicybe gibba]